ncbi:tail fiber domain-containing protein [Bacillus wiedmannii]|uniref:tail fiber domain-containing protein n=1 Tax=Bacillus wiedmannii TaxID=1890302 RepID=UPI002E1FC5B8|nr:tail fiber domain-containing protein [Bacillus wiedmannii]
MKGDIYGKGVKLTSDKKTKGNFSDVNALQILDKLAIMPIHSWNYKDDTASERHIGPTAQDFHDTFGLSGADNKHIPSIDIQGIALVAIQGLNEKNERLIAEIAQLHANLANLEARLSVLESKGLIIRTKNGPFFDGMSTLLFNRDYWKKILKFSTNCICENGTSRVVTEKTLIVIIACIFKSFISAGHLNHEKNVFM